MPTWPSGASTRSSPGPSTSCRNACAPSTCTGCIPTWASSSPSSSRRSCAGTSGPASASSTRSRAAARRSSSARRSARTASASTSRRSTSCSRGVKTARYDAAAVEHDLAGVLQRAEDWDGEPGGVPPSDYLRAWYHGDALDQLLRYRAALVSSPECVDLGRVVLSRAARSARLTTHFELDFPRRPQTGPYQCRKHSRMCAPTSDAAKFLRRYTLDTIRRVREYAALRADVRADVIHGDARTVDYARRPRRRDHVAALPRPDRLSRAAPLRVRAARPRRAPRRGDRRAVAWHGPRRHRCLRRRHDRRVRERAPVPRARARRSCWWWTTRATSSAASSSERVCASASSACAM